MIDRAASKTLVTVALMMGACSSPPTSDANSRYFIGTLSAEQIEQVCVFDQSCHLDNINGHSDIASESGMAQCLTALAAILPGHQSEGIPATSVRCAFTATSCAAYETCVGGGYSAGYCSSVGEQDSCDGEVAVSCFGAAPARYASDCAAQGLTCVVETDSGTHSSFCSAGTCTPSTTGTSMPHCVGTVSRDSCSPAGHYRAQDCARLAPGWICEEGRGCIDGTLPTCAGSSEGCEGTHRVSCTSGRTRDYDCATVTAGGTCMVASDATDYAYCVAGASAACDPYVRGVDTCVGTSLQSCAGGQRVTIDCVAHGFTGCADGYCTE